jgi:hypothetical protein
VKKEEGDATPPPSAKKTCIGTEEQLQYWTADDPKEFPGLRAAERASLNEVQPGTLDFVLAWSRQDAKTEEAKCAHCLGFLINLENNDDDEAGPSQRCGDNGLGCSSWAAKAKPTSDNEDNGDGGAYYDGASSCSSLVFFLLNSTVLYKNFKF